MPVSLKQQYLFLTVLETGNFKIKALVWGLVESTLPALQTTGFSLCPHMAERDRETKEVSSLLSLFMRAPIPFMRAQFPLHWLHNHPAIHSIQNKWLDSL